jgi:hypothetical protein
MPDVVKPGIDDEGQIQLISTNWDVLALTILYIGRSLLIIFNPLRIIFQRIFYQFSITPAYT